MDFDKMQDALREQAQRPTDHRAAERAIGAGLIRWATWCDSVGRGEGAAGTIRGETAPGHETRRSQFADLGVKGHGQLWSLVEMIAFSRLSQANGHARAIGTLLYHDGLSSSVRALLRVHAEACGRGVWVADPDVDARTGLHRAIAEFADVANAMSAPQRRRLHDETIRPLAEAAGLPLQSVKGGRWRASGKVRPDSRALIRETLALGKELAEWPTRSYGVQTAAVHSSFLAWATSLLEEDAPSLRVLSLDLLYAGAIHDRLQAIYEGWHDWRPHDATETARRASLSNLSLAVLNVERSYAGVSTGSSGAL